ncbi:MAG: bifunctional hydroxymethylpyrimidine kinase/phosphomethylpyrimidine kinase [Alphaproteobacteria bacterium]
MIPNVLSIAGSDPSGGAGVQADLKTFSALGAYGMAAITALTAQNTKGVTGVFEVSPEFVVQQVAAVFDDIRVDAVKIGMAGSAATIDMLADFLQQKKPPIFILDPVMVAQSGDSLLSDAAVKRLVAGLLPLASVVTPNIPEAEVLLGKKYDGDMEGFARAILKMGARAVLLKGGHLTGAVCRDVYADESGLSVFEEPRLETKNNHGTGCTLASALAVFMARGLPGDEAARAAKKYVTHALKESGRLSVGGGAGPVNHFHALWR